MRAGSLGSTLVLVVLSAGCGGRAIGQQDAGVPVDARRDQRSADALPRDGAAAACSRLEVLGSRLLGAVSGEATAPTVIAGGAGFGVAWLSGSYPTRSPKKGELRFTTVDRDGAPASTGGVFIDAVETNLAPQLAHRDGVYGILYNRPCAEGLDATTFRRVDGQGKTIGAASGIARCSWDAALVAGAHGYAAIYRGELAGTSALWFLHISPDGALALDSKVVDSGDHYSSVWLAPRGGGYTAAWSGTLVQLGTSGAPAAKPIETIAVKAMVPTYAAASAGYGVAYARSSDFFVEARALDSAGRPLGDAVPIVQSDVASAPKEQLSLVWTGSRYILVYFSPDGPRSWRAQLLSAALGPVGSPVDVPSCLIPFGGVSAAWSGGTLAVAHVAGKSGPPDTVICLSRLSCRP